MTKATREPNTDEYMELALNNDVKGMDTFIEECFGSHDDFDNDKAVEFSKKVIPLVEEEVQKMVDNVTEATPEIVEAAEENMKAVKEAEAKKVTDNKETENTDSRVEASTEDTAEVKADDADSNETSVEAADEATDKS